MNAIEEKVQYIVKETLKLKSKLVDEEVTPIDWVAIFAQSASEYDSLLKENKEMGSVVKDTKTGPIFKLNTPIETEAGGLQIIKIRKPDKTRPQRGDADFRLADYEEFKKKHLADNHFKLIEREDYEMIELKDDKFDVLVYFSNPPISEVLGLR